MVALTALWLASAPAAAELRAEQITPGTAEALDVGGPDAIGGVGDWWLASDVVEAVIDDVSRRHAKANHGGTLVDLGLRDRRGEDQFARLIPLVNLSQRVSAGYDAIRAELDPAGRWARLVVTSPGLRSIPRGGWLARRLDPLVPPPEALAAVRVETVYELRPGEPFLRVATTLTNAGDEPAPVFAWGDLWMRGGRSGRGFLGEARAPGRSRGFAARSVGSSAARSGDALAAFTFLALVGSTDFPPISYGYSAPGRAARGLPLYGMMQEHASLALAFVGDPDEGGFSWWRLLRAWWQGLPPGASWRFERRLHVSGRREVAAVSDAVYAELGLARESGVRGALDLGGRAGTLLIETPEGVPVTQLAPPELSAALPPGDYVAVLRVDQAPAQRADFSVLPGRVTPLAFAPPPPPAWLVFAPAFADGGPGRIELRGLGETPDPVFGDDGLGATLDGVPLASATASSALLFAGVDGDPREVALPPGRYALAATRGLDWEAATWEVELDGPGARAAVPPFALEPLPRLEEYVSADLHVHAEASDDSQTPNEERLRRFAAEGVDVLVATDHDHIAHYAPALARLGLAGRVRVVTGVEITSSTPSPAAPWTIGHHNAWPVPYAPRSHRDGAPESQVSVGELYRALRRDYGAQVVQLNHPRARDAGDTAGYLFEHLGVGRPFDRANPGAAPEGSLDFDALELMNGDGWQQYLAVRADWIALLRAGLRRTATANSDSHAPDELIGFPRNYVRVGRGEAERRDPARFDAALRAGASFGTTGPRVLRFAVNGARTGETARAEAGRVRIEWAVDAARWVPPGEVRILVDGEVVHATGERAGRLDWSLARDAFLHLEAGAPLDAEREAWIAAHAERFPLYTGVLALGFVSAAFTNAVYVEVVPSGSNE